MVASMSQVRLWHCTPSVHMHKPHRAVNSRRSKQALAKTGEERHRDRASDEQRGLNLICMSGTILPEAIHIGNR
jgi:hypothetical protein